MARRGRPLAPFAKYQGVFVRFSDTEWGALQQARQTEHPAPTRRPTRSEWIRDLMAAHAKEVLQVEVTRARSAMEPAVRRTGSDGALARAVRRAAPRRRKPRR